MLISQGIAATLAGVLGLLVGSFLNVVICRLPKMLERRWAADCAELAGAADSKSTETFNLILPRSHCPQCRQPIRWYENIPALSFVLLRGKCAACSAPISVRYPLVELATSALFFGIVWEGGLTASSLAWCGFAATLLALALIDWDTTLLPDNMTLPLLWAGLIAAQLRWIDSTLVGSLWGAIAAYLSLWLIYWAFKWITGKEGMGYGDFKLFAALGAWFGWQALVPIILLASLSGALVGVALKFRGGLREGGVLPFGPFLAVSGLTAMVLGPATILRWIGI